MPGFLVAKKETTGTVHATHVSIMMREGVNVVSVMPDYEGPLEPFAIVMPVPNDVVADHLKTLKREFVDRLEMLTAPRFMEFWEMDPCDPGPLEQEWERSKLAAEGPGFLGGGSVGGEKKVAKELLIDIKPEYKEGEYTISLLEKDKAADLGGFLKEKGYVLTAKAAQAVKPYQDAGMHFVVAEVDPKRIELVGAERAQLSPIRYWTKSDVTKIPAKLGLVSLDKKQELFVYVMHPTQRFEAKNYPNLVPPTNITVDFVAKERMGELFTAIHDRIQKKDPKSFLVEYAWTTEGCGQPCQNEPLLLNELMSLGGDVIEEQTVPEDQKNPEPPELTEEEKKKHEEELKALKPNERPKAKKDFEADRKEIARRKGMIERQKYVLSRLHHLYDASNLPDDPEIQPAGPLVGGAYIPKGEKKEISTEVKPGEKNQLQIRFNFFHEWRGMMKCDKPERWRWGKPPKDYRGLRKTWVAFDLTRKSRTQIDPEKVVQTAVPSLGLSGVPVDADAGTDGGTGAEPTKKKGCGCEMPGAPDRDTGFGALFAAALVVLGRRRRG